MCITRGEDIRLPLQEYIDGPPDTELYKPCYGWTDSVHTLKAGSASVLGREPSLLGLLEGDISKFLESTSV
jgi:hypothetical protein